MREASSMLIRSHGSLQSCQAVQVVSVVGSELLEVMQQLRGGLLGEDHSWV